MAGRSRIGFSDSMVKHCRSPMRLIIPLLFCNFLLPMVKLPPETLLFVKQTLGLLLIGAVAWPIIRLIYVVEDVILGRLKIDAADNLRARGIHTQIQILKKVVVVVVTILALAAMLMTFDKVRHLGTSILASAGIAGIIVGREWRETSREVRFVYDQSISIFIQCLTGKTDRPQGIQPGRTARAD